MKIIFEHSRSKIMLLLTIFLLITLFLPSIILAQENSDTKEINIFTTANNFELYNDKNISQPVEKSTNEEYNIYSFNLTNGNYSYAIDKGGSGKLSISNNTDIYLREIQYTLKNEGCNFKMEVINTEISDLIYTSDITTGKTATLFVPAYGYNIAYRYSYVPQDPDYCSFSGDLWVEKGSEAFEGFKNSSYNLSDGGQNLIGKKVPVEFSIPHDATLHIYQLIKFYTSPNEYETTYLRTENGQDIYQSYISSTVGGNYYYTISNNGYVTKANTFKPSVGSIIIDNLTENPQQQFSEEHESSILINGNISKHISLNQGDSFGIWSSRAWQAINGITANRYVEPDKHYSVISGDSVTVDNQGIVHAVNNGTSIVTVSYDALDYQDKLYSAIKNEDIGVFVFSVGENTDEITSNINLSDLDTIYFSKSIAIDGFDKKDLNASTTYTFKPESTGSPITVSSCTVTGYPTPTQSAWEDYTSNDDGSYTVNINNGRNIIRMATENSENYFVIKGIGSDIKVTNKTSPGENPKVGNSIEISLSGIETPLPKLGAIYNPGFGNTINLEYKMNDSLESEPITINSKGVQYDISTTPITITLEKEGTYTFSDGHINLGAFGSAFTTHLILSPQSRSGNYSDGDAPETDGTFCVLPEFSIPVETQTDEAAAKEIINLIDSIGDITYDDACHSRITSAKTTYDRTTDDVRDLIPKGKVTILTTAETRYNGIDQSKNNIRNIGTIGLRGSENCFSNLKIAQNSIDALSTEDQNKVPNLFLLKNAQTKYKKVIDTLISDIDALLPLSDKSESAINKANSDYSDYIKRGGDAEKITNHDTLDKAENDFLSQKEINIKNNIQQKEIDQNTYYILTNYVELEWFGKYVNGTLQSSDKPQPDANAMLTNDISANPDLLNTVFDSNHEIIDSKITQMKKWETIQSYNGIFDGADHTISGLYGNDALFKSVTNQIKDLHITDSLFNSSNFCAGYAIEIETNGRIEKCSFDGEISSLFKGAGIACNNSGTVVNCYNHGNIIVAYQDHQSRNGGIVASVDDPNAMVNHCYNTGTIKGGQFSGGIAGLCVNNENIKNSYYLDGSALGGINLVDEEGATKKTATQFENGEVAYLLEKGYGQKIGTDSLPVFYNGLNGVFPLDDGFVNGCSVDVITRLISNIGTIALDGSDQCFNNVKIANIAYNELSESDQALVENYDLLKNANNAYDQIVANLIKEIDALYPLSIDKIDAVKQCNIDYSAFIEHGGDQTKITNNETLRNALEEIKPFEIEANQKNTEASIQTKNIDNQEYYVLTNTDELIWFQDLVNGTLKTGTEQNMNANAILENDLTFNENLLLTIVDPTGNIVAGSDTNLQKWTPIGIDDYTGIFDGNNHTISGLINTEIRGGLFCNVNGSIKNLNLIDSYIGKKSLTENGGIASILNSNGSIENCNFDGILIGRKTLGRITGTNNGGTINHCHSNGQLITSFLFAESGGITGKNSGTIKNCYSFGEFKNLMKFSTQQAGGISGYNNGTIENCYANNTFNNYMRLYGGIVGKNSGDGISNCYYLKDTAPGGIDKNDIPDQAEAKTLEAFSSGEITVKLGQEFGQIICVDNYPVFSNGTNKVYQNNDTYSNTPLPAYVIELIGNLNEKITPDDEEAIKEARQAYNSLNIEQQQQIINIDQLVAAENSLTNQKNMIIIQPVIDKINAIPENSINITLNDKKVINSARCQYDKLTNVLKECIPSDIYTKLTCAEEKIIALEKATTDQTAADQIIASVNDILEINNLTLNQKYMINTIRENYDALTDEQKLLINDETYQIIVNAEKRMIVLEKEANDQTAADQIITPIDNLPETDNLTLDQKDIINTIRENFDTLTDKQKLLINDETYQLLVNAEEKMMVLEKAASDKALADTVTTKIASFPDPKSEAFTLDCEMLIQEIRADYEALTDDQQGYVDADNLEKLIVAEEKITELKTLASDQEKADVVSNLIRKFNDPITLSDEASILNARKAYDNLSESQQNLIQKDVLQKLSAAESTYTAQKAQADADQKAAQELIQKIDDLGEITLEKASDVAGIRDTYTLLTEQAKALINAETLTILSHAEATIANLTTAAKDKAAAKLIDDAILSLPSPITVDDIKTVESIRNDYVALTTVQKKYINQLDRLTQAESEVKVLKIIAGIHHSEDIIDNNAGGVDDAVKEAQDAYNALTDEQKALAQAEKDDFDKKIAALAKANHQITTPDNTLIQATTPNGECLSLDVKLALDENTTNHDALAKEINKDMEILKTMHLILIDTATGNPALLPESGIKITLQSSELKGYDLNSIVICHIKADGTTENLKGIYDPTDQTITFTTQSFSDFILMATKTKSDSPSSGDANNGNTTIKPTTTTPSGTTDQSSSTTKNKNCSNPKTSVKSNHFSIFAMVCGLLLLTSVSVILKRKQRLNK